MTATERYYLHGDPKEGAVDTYYCQRCDLFVGRAHFAGCRLGTVHRYGARYVETHEWRYVAQRRRLFQTFVVGDRRRIEDDPGNLFRTGTPSEQRLPQLVREGAEAARPPTMETEPPPVAAPMPKATATTGEVLPPLLAWLQRCG